MSPYKRTNGFRPTDLAGTRGGFLGIWGIPAAVIVLTGFYDQASLASYAWPPALAWMGTACLYNARRCGRRHCRITGPFFLAMAVLALLHGWSPLALGAHGWTWLGGITAAGALVLTFAPEWLWGRYVK